MHTMVVRAAHIGLIQETAKPDVRVIAHPRAL